MGSLLFNYFPLKFIILCVMCCWRVAWKKKKETYRCIRTCMMFLRLIVVSALALLLDLLLLVGFLLGDGLGHGGRLVGCRDVSLTELGGS